MSRRENCTTLSLLKFSGSSAAETLKKPCARLSVRSINKFAHENRCNEVTNGPSATFRMAGASGKFPTRFYEVVARIVNV